MIKTLRKIILLFIFTFMPVMQAVFADETIKINSINFDNSDSIIFLGISQTLDKQTSKITKKVLKDPDRVYFDIENAQAAFPNRTYEFKNSRLKRVRAAQNSLAPDIVRIVIEPAAGYDLSNISVFSIKNNIIIKLDAEKPRQQYLTQVYKETKSSAPAYYDKAVIIEEDAPEKEGVIPQFPKSEADEIFNSVQKAFSASGEELVRPNIEQKQARLKSRYFLEDVSAGANGIFLSGIGVVNLEKPFVLTEPSRIVFDLPNTVVKQELRDKEIKISDKESIRIGQFEMTKARIAIKTPEPEKYAPVYLPNLQTLFIKNTKQQSKISPMPAPAELTMFNTRSIDVNTEEINMSFSNPAVFSITRTSGNWGIVLYNLKSFNAAKFNETTEYKAEKISSGAYLITFNQMGDFLADCYESLDASQLRLVLTKTAASEPDSEKLSGFNLPMLKEPDEKAKKDKDKDKIKNKEKDEKKSIFKKQKKEEQRLLKKLNSRPIVLDPGHGGTDTGALRGSLMEKDLTLKTALKVREYLNEMGLTNILMTRETDKYISLDERVQISNIHNTSIYVSIHINASVKSEINGIETHYYTDSGYKAAQIIHKELVSDENSVNAADRGLFKSRFYVIKNTEAPAVLLELGFISNAEERRALMSEERRSASAKAIADGIYKFLILTENKNE